MSRFLSIDWGEKYIGLAISDPLGLIAQGLDVWEKRGDKEFIERLKILIEEYSIAGIVLGYPISLKGHENDKTKRIKEIADMIKNSLNVPVYLVDERFSTMEAEKVLLDANVKRKDRKILKNKQAAVIILQKFLSSYSLDTQR